jgi:hypothetical protein
VSKVRLIRSDDRFLNLVVDSDSIASKICMLNFVLWLFFFFCLHTDKNIAVLSNGDVIGLSRFIITRLLGNPDIACEFSHPSVPHLYKDGNVIISPVLKSYNFVLDHIIYIKAYCKVLTFCFLSFSIFC